MSEMSDMRTARIAFAEAVSEEFGVDMNPEWMAACDRILMRLWLFGYRITPIAEEP
jgi:hypothetical protein